MQWDPRRNRLNAACAVFMEFHSIAELEIPQFLSKNTSLFGGSSGNGQLKLLKNFKNGFVVKLICKHYFGIYGSDDRNMVTAYVEDREFFTQFFIPLTNWIFRNMNVDSTNLSFERMSAVSTSQFNNSMREHVCQYATILVMRYLGLK